MNNINFGTSISYKVTDKTTKHKNQFTKKTQDVSLPNICNYISLQDSLTINAIKGIKQADKQLKKNGKDDYLVPTRFAQSGTVDSLELRVRNKGEDLNPDSKSVNIDMDKFNRLTPKKIAKFLVNAYNKLANNKSN